MRHRATSEREACEKERERQRERSGNGSLKVKDYLLALCPRMERQWSDGDTRQLNNLCFDCMSSSLHADLKTLTLYPANSGYTCLHSECVCARATWMLCFQSFCLHGAAGLLACLSVPVIERRALYRG